MEWEGRGSGRGSGKSLVPRLEFSHELEVLGKRDVDQDLSPAERRDDFVRECELEMR